MYVNVYAGIGTCGYDCGCAYIRMYVRMYAVFLCAQYVCVRTCVCTYIIKHTYIVGGGGV